jgi:type II secretory pathway component HofQ
MTDRRVGTALNAAVRQRNYRRARDRALAKLAQRFPDDYRQLMEKEKESDEQLGKKWLDITGSTTASQMGTRADATATRPQTIYGGEDEGDRGGEA